jgi:hypothetical protein
MNRENILERQRDNLRTELQHVLTDIEQIKKLCDGKDLLLKAITGRQRQIEKTLEEN